MPSPRPVPKVRRSGFALLITITLLAFLVLLLVSLASLTRVETQVASNNHQLSKARQNALLGLHIALGRLQALAGPDRRVTATADIVSGVHDDKRRWTGVWNTTAATPVPEWLVSTVATTPLTGTASVTTAIPTAGTVLLVGSKTVDTDTAGNAVVVETQPITSDAVPGVPGSQTVGNFAWWVGDEGVKAKVSLIDPGASSTATADQQAYRLRIAQRSGIELVDSTTGSALTTANYPANDTGLSKVLDLKQLPFTSSAGQAALNTAVKNRFHDLTTRSCSLLADVAQGGLKKDLTSWLAHPSGLPASAPADTDYITPPHSTDTSGYGLPRWGLIRSYAGFESGVPRAPQQQTATQQGFHPVITYFRLSFSASCDEDTPANPTPPLRIHAYPIVVLWNPHDTPIASSQYELAYGLRYNTATNVFIRTGAGDASAPSWQTPPNTRKGRLLMNTAEMTNAAAPALNGAQATRRYFRFLLDLTEPLGAGESRVFTLDDTGLYTAGTTGNLPNRMSANPDFRKDNSAYFENPSMTMSASEIWVDAATRTTRKQFYVLTNGGEMEFGLFPVQPPGTNPTVAESLASNPYQLIQNIGIGEYARRITGESTADMDDSHICTYHWGLMQMSKGNKYFRTPRWLAQNNPRAPLYLVSAAFTSQVYVGSSNAGVPGGNTYQGNMASAGESIPAPPVTNTSIVGFPPGSPSTPWKRFFSLAQLQHANLSLLSQNPAYAVGNSQASYHIFRSDGSVGLADSSISGAPLSNANTVTNPANQLQRLYDLSYLLNRDLWDRYFFSTIPSSGPDALAADHITSPAFRLPNSRHVFNVIPDDAASVAADLVSANAFDTASARLLVNGGFNVNSTSEQAWRALLASNHNVDTASGGLAHPFARLPSTEAGDPANQSWASSYRILSDAQINTLARCIVTEVRTRGPFLSLADFVNRRLVNNDTGYKGPLQAAIDAADTEANAAYRINDRPPFNDYSSDVNTTHRIVTYASIETGTTTADFQKLFSGGTSTTNTPSASRAAFGPGFLTQADLLNSLGPVLAARSDTFVIRAYGDVQNPASSQIEGKAWCEAVVQRLPGYVDPSVDPWTTPASGSDSDTFGRRFKVVSFRWLNPDDI